MNYFALPGIKVKKNELMQHRFNYEFNRVCDFFNKDAADVLNHNKSRNFKYLRIRQITSHIIREKYKYSLVDIGKFFDKDHATILHGLRSLQNDIYNNRNFRNEIKQLIEQ